jgi:hypothetical protein
MRLRTRLGTLAATVLAASGIILAVPGPAHAGGYGCTGKLIREFPVPTDWLVMSDVRLYYNSSTGYSCAVNVKRPRFRDKRTHMWIHMFNGNWREDNARRKVTFDDDQGKFKWYAGPIWVKGRNLTVHITATTDYDGDEAYVSKSVRGDRG